VRVAFAFSNQVVFRDVAVRFAVLPLATFQLLFEKKKLGAAILAAPNEIA
jgi:hypothetical protein